MKSIIIIFNKELIDTLRDKKTLFSAIILPAIVLPLLLIGLTKLQKKLINEESNKQLKISLINSPKAIQDLFKDPLIKLITNVDIKKSNDSIVNDDIDAVLEFNEDFDTNINTMHPGTIRLYYKSTNLMVHKRIMEKLEVYKSTILYDRIKHLKIPEKVLVPIEIKTIDIATPKEQISKIVGFLLSYVFIIFCFTGCMYPALDLITGEKERSTLETLLTVPTSRFKILVSKMLTISAIGICAALMTIVGMFTALKFMDKISTELLTTLNDMMSAKFILMLIVMLIPLSLFFAGLLTAIAIRASSFKEAQTYVTPLMFIVLLPAIIALLPGVELTWQTVWIPILNIALAIREIIAGSIDFAKYTVILMSLIILAIIAIAVSINQFSKETNVLN